MPIEKTPKVEHGEAESLAQTVFMIALILIGLVAFGIAFGIASSPFTRDPGIQSWKSALFVEIMLAVGTSIFSSLLIYFFYSRVVEKRVLKVVTSNAAEVAASYATSLYENRFERMMPTEVYSAAATPKPEFEEHLTRVLHESRIYWFKGDAGGYTVYRLNQLTNHHHLLEKAITLLVLDPNDDYLLRERTKIELAEANASFTKDDLSRGIDHLRKSIFATVVAVFDNAHRARVNIGFHKEHLFFRSEIFDEGLFLTYYLGGEFPATCFYPKKTLTYKACIENFRQIEKSATPTFSFSAVDSDTVLIDKLGQLGCPFDLRELREFKDSMFANYSKLKG